MTEGTSGRAVSIQTPQKSYRSITTVPNTHTNNLKLSDQQRQVEEWDARVRRRRMHIVMYWESFM